MSCTAGHSVQSWARGMPTLHALLRGVSAHCFCTFSAVVLVNSCLGHQQCSADHRHVRRMNGIYCWLLWQACRSALSGEHTWLDALTCCFLTAESTLVEVVCMFSA